MVCLGLDGRLSFALMLRRKNAHIAAGYASQPCSSPERKILRALRMFRRGGWQSARKGLRSRCYGARSVCSAPKGLFPLCRCRFFCEAPFYFKNAKQFPLPVASGDLKMRFSIGKADGVFLPIGDRQKGGWFAEWGARQT